MDAPAAEARVPSVAGPDLYSYYAWLRKTHPVHFDDRVGAWFLSRYDDCAAALRDPRLSAEQGQERRRRSDALPRSMLNTDPPAHARLRSPAAAVMAPARLERLRSRMEPVAAQLAGSAAGRPEFDAISAYAAPLAVAALATLLGIPGSDVRLFARLTRAASVNLDPLAGDDTVRAGRHAALELAEYLHDLITQGRAMPGQALATLAASYKAPDGQTPSLDEALSTLVLFVVGGYEPLVNLVGNGLHTLATHPDQARRLREDSNLWRTAVDELLRFESPIPFTARVCREDVDMRGEVLPRGATVVVLLAAANRDPEVFADPDQVDVGRRPNPMLAFGGGPHLCLAASMTRVIGQLALSVALARFSPVTLASDQQATRWRTSLVPRGLERLDLRVTA
jgi:cytochrome P450